MSETDAEKLLSLLKEEVKSASRHMPRAAVLFSGGLDSSIVAAVCSKQMPVTLYSVGTAGSHDVDASAKAARDLGLELVSVIAGVDDVISSAESVEALFGRALGFSPSRMDISIYSPMYFLLGFVREKDVFTGQGADELFGGYSRYLRMGDDERARSMERDASALMAYGIKRDMCIAERFGIRLHLPFLSPAVVSYAAALPQSSKIHGGVRKRILRECASLLSLPAACAEKKAMQYGSGFDRIIQKK